jgi:hypothetical protein
MCICFKETVLTEREKAVGLQGRAWIAPVLTSEEEEAEFLYWQENFTPAERVDAVADCLLACLRAHGIDEIPRLQKVCRIVNGDSPEDD